MSQHFYPGIHQGRPITILMGFDRPLQGFFMVIELDQSGDDAYLYTNLYDPELIEFGGLPGSLDHFLAKLTEFGLSVPQLMINEILNDARSNAGNRCVLYDAVGNIESSN